MKSKTLKLESINDIEQIRKTCMMCLNSFVKDKKHKIEVVIRNERTKAQKRNDAQNSLNWVWCGDEANFHNKKEWHIGKEYIPDDIHLINKLTYGIPILCRDVDFMMFWQPYRNLIREDKLRALKYIPVTSIMSIEQMTEYLSTMKIDKESKGIILNDNEDLFNQAMGRSKAR